MEANQTSGLFRVPASQTRRIIAQLLFIFTISAALGFSFNSSNPIGVRFKPEPAAASNDQSPTIEVQPLPTAPAVPNASHQNPANVTAVDFTSQSASVPGRIVHVPWAAVKPHVVDKHIVIVDARPKVNYDQGHIPGAVNLPHASDPKFCATPEDYQAFQKKYDKDAPIVVYCTTRMCQLSQIVAEKLVNEYGFTNVRKMNEGYLEYTEAESVTNATHGATVATAGSEEPFVKDPTASAQVHHVEWAAVKPLLASKKVVLIDARPKVNYDMGHIPGAISLPFASDRRFAAQPADFEAFQKAYPKDTPIVVYCTTRMCQLSQIISEKLVELGYKNISKMNQGFLEYGEIEKDAAGEGAPHAFGEFVPGAVVGPVNSPSERNGALESPANRAAILANPSRVSWAEVKLLHEAKKIVLVDVRQTPTFELGHIPGAINLSYTSAEPAYQEFTKRYPKDAHIVLYCTDMGCPLSTKMAELLATKYGYKHVQHMTEGYAEWQRFNVQAKAANESK
jgi:rhodanese-related sulfurtransferase